jgi:hypothetical protein
VAKQSGLGSRFLTGGYDISGDVQALDSVTASTAMQDGTDITQSAHARIPLLRDGTLAFSVFFDSADAHPVLSALPVADQLMTALLPPLGLGSAAACLNAKQIGYDPTRGADGSLMLKVEGQGSGYGLEWGLQLTPGLRTDTTATDGADLDNGASSAFGAQAYLQLTAFTGTNVTVTVEHSADNSTYSTLMAFTAATAAPYTQRISVSNATTVDRYLRVSSTGTFSSATFAVVVNRNLVAGTVF